MKGAVQFRSGRSVESIENDPYSFQITVLDSGCLHREAKVSFGRIDYGQLAPWPELKCFGSMIYFPYLAETAVRTAVQAYGLHSRYDHLKPHVVGRVM